MQHLLFSQNQDMPIEFFEKFDRQEIKQRIIDALKKDPTDVIEHCREYPKNNVKKFYGNEILSFYQVNPKNGKPSKVITRGNKEYFMSLV
jgi:hypothetical protein